MRDERHFSGNRFGHAATRRHVASRTLRRYDPRIYAL
jgi:hypothetical protein